MRFGIKGYALIPASETDAEYVVECIRKTVLESVSEEEAAMSELWIGGILDTVKANLGGAGMRNEPFILRRDDGKRCGALWMGESKDQYTCDDTGYILGIYVEEELRGAGLGTELMRSAERWCSERGLLSVTLNVGAWNKGARELYESAGFSERSAVMRKEILR